MHDSDDDSRWPAARQAYLELAASQTYIALAEGDNRLYVRRGLIGRPGLELRTVFVTPGRCASTYSAALQTVRDWGYTACTPSQPVQVGCVAHQLVSTDIVEHPDHSEIFDLAPATDWRVGAPRRLLHFRDGLVFDGDLDLEVLADLGLAAGAIIEGPVRIGGVLSQDGLDVLAAVLIRGDVRATSLVHRDGHIRITGDLHVEHAVWGQYNDGYLDVQGTVYADAWIAGVHDMRAGRIVARATEVEHLKPELLDADGVPDESLLAACIHARLSPARDDLPAAQPLPADTAPPATDALCERYADADPAVQRLVDLMARPALKARLLAALGPTAPPPAVMRRHTHVLLAHALIKNSDHPDRYLEVIERLLECGVDPSLRDAAGEDWLGQSLLRDQPGVVALLARRWPHWHPG